MSCKENKSDNNNNNNIINNNSNNNSQALLFCRSRVIRLDKRSEECLGLKINGGNCVGIYVTGFQKQSLAEEAGVRIGDRLLQVKECSLYFTLGCVSCGACE